jgi:hypothetical protein
MSEDGHFHDGQDSQSRGSMEFVESAILDTVVPASTTIDIEEALSGSVERLDDGQSSPLGAIMQRQNLFFGTFGSQFGGPWVSLIHRS